MRWILLVTITAVPISAATCESLSDLKLPDTTITTAQKVDQGAFTPPNARAPISDLPAFCRVAATLRPSSDSDIKIEVWMPASNWNGKFMAVGNGGWAGTISYGAMVTALKDGYATASTDTGHEGASARFAPGHPEKLKDFAYRAVHEMTVKAKAIITAYAQAPKRSYWNGCSTGGRQGLKEAQKFPADYDGILAGAPANNWVALMTGIVWGAHAAHKNEPGNLTEANLARLHAAVLQACDASDGVRDAVLENPAACKFDPKILECTAANESGCFTPAQVNAVRMMYSGPINPRTKKMIYPGMVPGSELGWDPAVGLQPLGIGVSHFQYVVFNNPNWDYSKLNYDSDIAQAWKLDTDLITAMDPNLKPFFDRGGKLLQYHGWNDQQISPLNSIHYYDSVLKKLGGPQSSYRLFMQPGVKHCRGGNGPDRFDGMRVLEDWVESGKAPNQILATHMTDGKVDRSRPLCPYPQLAVYKGAGSTDDANNFVCKH